MISSKVATHFGWTYMAFASISTFPFGSVAVSTPSSAPFYLLSFALPRTPWCSFMALARSYGVPPPTREVPVRASVL